MTNNLLIHADNLTALNYLLTNGFKGKIDCNDRLEKSNFHNRRQVKRCLRKKNALTISACKAELKQRI
jgi:hypothetical protein